MSSHTQSAHTIPRRRGRNHVEDNGSVRAQPSRKRHKTSANGTAPELQHDDQPNGSLLPANAHSLPVRQRHRHLAESALTTFAKNDNFTASQLPALPKELRQCSHYRGSFDSSTNLALALTTDTAFVWTYSANSPSPSVKTVRLSQPTRQDEPLPFGSLVQSGAQNEIGLVVVHPRSGKVAYWENVDNADALSVFAHRRTAHEGSLALYSGETVIQLQHASVAGFIILTSSDRVAQLQLRDTQSRPAINVQYLRSPKKNASGGLFGNILSAFSAGGLLKDTSATLVQCTTSRGPVDLTIASEHGQFQRWQLSWSDPPHMLAEWDIQHDILLPAQRNFDSLMPSPVHAVRISALEHLPDHYTNSLTKSAARHAYLALLAISAPSYETYALAAISLNHTGSSSLDALLHLACYSPPLASKSSFKPDIHLPAKSTTVYAFFDKALVLLSIAGLHLRTPNDLNRFQDCLYLKDDASLQGREGISIDATAGNDHQSHAFFFVHGTGPVVITVPEPQAMPTALTRQPLSVRRKIEQAILFGTKQANPFNLSRKPELPLNRDEIETIVLQISRQVLKSDYPELAQNTAATDQQIARRLRVLEDLASHIRNTYPGLSRRTRWKLLWDSEKLAVARTLNAIYDAAASSSLVKRNEEVNALADLIENMSEAHRSVTDGEWDAVSHVAHYMVHDADKMQDILAWFYNAVWHFAEHGRQESPGDLMPYARDIVAAAISAYQAAFSHRRERMWDYDLHDAISYDGVLQSTSSYEGLSAPWTSMQKIPIQQFELARGALLSVQEAFEEANARGEKHSDASVRLSDNVPVLIRVWATISQEQMRWCQAQPEGSHERQVVSEYSKQFRSNLEELLEDMGRINHTMAGIEIAEDYSAMSTLTKLVREENQSLVRLQGKYEHGVAPENAGSATARLELLEKTNEKLRAIEQRVTRYFHTFGYQFTNPYFSSMIKKHNFYSVLQQNETYGDEVTEFLRAEDFRKPLCWINDVLSQRDYAHAGEVLTTQATTHELKAWHRGVELGFAKLALLAADENDEAQSQTASAPGQLEVEPMHQSRKWAQHERTIERASALLQIQKSFWDRVRSLTRDAVDLEAGVQIISETLGRNLQAGKRKRLFGLLSQIIEHLVSGDALGADDLVDLLTLSDAESAASENIEIGEDVFFLALRAVENALDANESSADVSLKSCWRRAMLAVDWDEFNKKIARERLGDETVKEELRKTSIYKTLLEGFRKSVEKGAELGEAGTEDDTLQVPYLGTLPVPSPQECLFAGTTVEDWVLRLGENMREQAEEIARECRVEETWLRDAIEHQQLAKWWSACRKLALQDLRREV